MTRVILLNGVGSAGKSTLARAIQDAAGIPLLHVEMDAFLDMLPARYADHPEAFSYRRIDAATVKIEAGPLGLRLMRGMRDAVAALAAAGNDLIVDDVLEADGIADYREVLAGFEVSIIGVTAPVDEIERRERSRGDRSIGLTAGQLRYMHLGIEYDLVVDTAAAAPDVLARRLCGTLGIPLA
jgi:chloramphenicol 3-O phosphotransferase